MYVLCTVGRKFSTFLSFFGITKEYQEISSLRTNVAVFNGPIIHGLFKSSACILTSIDSMFVQLFFFNVFFIFFRVSHNHAFVMRLKWEQCSTICTEIASLLCHFSSFAVLDLVPVSSDVESSGHKGLALETHRGACNYPLLWLPLLWSGLFNSHYRETLLWLLCNGPLAQF